MTGIIDRLQETLGRAQAGELSERMPEKEGRATRERATRREHQANCWSMKAVN
jgi:hypothetical protein